MIGYYRRFIKNYGTIYKPLTELLKKEGFKWGSEAKLAFEKLKLTIMTAPMLNLLDFNQPFVIETDASGSGMGAILIQQG